MSMPETQPYETFTRPDPVWPKVLLHVVPGVVFLLGLTAYLVVLVNRPSRPGDDMMPGILGGASVIGIGMIARGLFLLRTTTRVVLDPTGVAIETPVGRKFVRWLDVAKVQRDKRSPILGGATYQVVQLVDRSGKTVATVAETVGDFDRLAAEVTARASAAAGQSAYDATADDQRRASRDARKIRLVAVGFVLFTLAMLAAFSYGLYEDAHLRRYATDAVRTDARVVRRWMVNVTPHVEYAFTDPGGQVRTRDAMMWQGPEWDALEGAKTVPVEYLPSDPSWNRLVAGEDPGPQFGGKFLYLTGFGVLMFGTLAVTSLLGYDLKSENGVQTLTRHGRTIKTWGKPAGPDLH